MKVIKYLFVALLVCNFAIADTIYFKNGTSYSDVKILSESHQKVSYQRRNRTISTDAETVNWIEYSDTPQELISGRSAITKGDYEGAVSYINSAAEVAKMPPAAGAWFEIYSNYLLGKAYQGWADSDPEQSDLYKTAIKHYKSIEKSKGNRYLYECYFGIAQCYISLADYSKANDFLRKLESESRNNSKYWEVQAVMWQGHKSLAQKSFTGALGKYQRAQSLASKEESLKQLEREAAVAIGNCYIQDKKFSQATRHFEDLKSYAKKSDYELHAAVENGLAMTLLEEGKIDSARRKALNVVLKYYEAEEERPQALYIAGLCYEKATSEKDHLKRARTCYQFLREGYPGNPWTIKALRRLQKIPQQE